MTDPSRCAFDLQSAAGLDAPLLAAEGESAPPFVRFVDLTDLVCPTDPCSVITEDGMIKYRDQHHLTQTFARSLAPAVAARLRAVLE